MAVIIRRPIRSTVLPAIRSATIGSGAEDSEVAKVLDRMENLSPQEVIAITNFVESMIADDLWRRIDDFWCFHLNESDHGTGWKEFYVNPFNGTQLLSHSVQKGITRAEGSNLFGVYEISAPQSSFRQHAGDPLRSSWGMAFSEYTYSGGETFGWCSSETAGEGGHMLRRRHADGQLFWSTDQDASGRSSVTPGDVPADWDIIAVQRIASSGNINYYVGGGSSVYQDATNRPSQGYTSQKAVFPGGRNEAGNINNARECSISMLYFGTDFQSTRFTQFQTHYEQLLDDLGVVRT